MPSIKCCGLQCKFALVVSHLQFDSGYYRSTKSAQDMSAEHNLRRKKMNKLCYIRRYATHLLKSKLQNRPHKTTDEIKNLYAKISFAFNGNSLQLEHDCIFALPLRLSVNRYYKQVISAQSQ